MNALRGSANGTHGMVTSPHALATQCGVDVLAAGGNAVEAAIATVAALCVTYPHFCGLGGDAFLIVANRSGDVQTISGIGQAAHNIADYPIGGAGAAITVRGPRSALTSAGTVDALGRAFEMSRAQMGGACSWESLWAPAVRLAREGFELTDSARFWLNFRAEQAHTMPDVFAAFGVNGAVPPAGHVCRQPLLADTLETLAVRGARDFYRGRLALRLAKGLADAGSPLRAADLGATRARLEPPLRMDYRGGTLLAHQPPTQGITTLQIMGILQRFDGARVPEGSADYYHLLVEATKRAFMDRNAHVADPEFASLPAHLLTSAHLDQLAASICMDTALAWPHAFKTGDTVYVGAADSQGNAVSMLATVYFDWGSGVMVGNTGVLWHNRGASFSLDPQHPNALAAGKRPFHTLNPGMYLKDGKPAILYGTQGADGQPQTLAAVLTRLIDYRMDPMQALSRPRFLLGKTFSDATDSLKLEADVSGAVMQHLAARGHSVSRVDAQSPLMGHPGAIVIDALTGRMTGAHDPRSDGVAIGLNREP
jgi:gamma-glutamyltranspeptidase/glutathione hydrolase